jgi:hypothetical protein
MQGVRTSGIVFEMPFYKAEEYENNRKKKDGTKAAGNKECIHADCYCINPTSAIK